jgi:Ca-activated chloride channel family protein
MTLLAPLALIGLLTVPIILVLHLLRNRRQQLYISSLHLWRDLDQKVHGSLPRFIPISLMLILQLCVAGGLTLALARPALSFLLDRPRQTIFILDTTTSMTAEDVSLAATPTEVRPRFDVARQIIQAQLQTLDQEDTFAVISLEPRPQILLDDDGEQALQAVSALDNLVPGGTGVDLPAALTLANSLIDSTDRDHQILVFTDGDYTVEPASLPTMLAPVTWQIISSRPEPEGIVSNQALLNVSARTLPDDRHRIFARIINYGDTPVVRTLRLTADEHPFDETTVNLEPEGESALVWTLPPATGTAAVEIVEADMLPLDNRAELLLADTTQQRVLLISDTPDTLAQALEAQPGLELTVDTLAMERYDPQNFDVVVFESLPPSLTEWPKGNLLIVNPPLGHPLLPAQNFARDLRPDLESSSTLLTGVDLSGVLFSRVAQLALPEWAEADLVALPTALDLEVDQGQPLIFHGTVNGSHIVVWAFDLAESNLPARLALPLITANTLSMLASAAPPAVVLLGEPVLLGGNYSVEIPGERRLFPSSGGDNNTNSVFSRTKQPGVYRVYNEADTLVAGFAVQAGSALESNLKTQLQPDLLDLAPSPDQAGIGPKIEYNEFWIWLAGLALVVVIIEGWLAWRT